MVTCFCSQALALSDAEYKELMKNKSFANADKALNNAWSEAKNLLYGSEFENFKINQQQWIKTKRDEEAKYFINNKGLSKIEAYTKVTEARANYINHKIKESTSCYDILLNRITLKATQFSNSSKPNAQASNFRAWNNKNNLVVFEYSGKNSFLISFWTSDRNIIFNDNIKIGMSLNELRNIFENDENKNFNTYYDGKIYNVAAGNRQSINFGIKNNNVSFIEFWQAGETIPAKIQNIINSYSK